MKKHTVSLELKLDVEIDSEGKNNTESALNASAEMDMLKEGKIVLKKENGEEVELYIHHIEHKIGELV
ncbi:hypothetical protein [Salipaludibacillus sp. CF4.18]|uniref:hypothetical protein n=1 Tax=Salipaludibacillus sp. CF4.18 TaxID=3373081 RepID=UPI003EE761ED